MAIILLLLVGLFVIIRPMLALSSFVFLVTEAVSGHLKPATNGRNNPASESWIRCHEERSIFLSNKPDINDLRRVWLKENADLRRLSWLGHFDHRWLVLSDR
jgi:hypothetical protein